MSKKTWTTIMTIALVVAAAVSVFFLTQPGSASAETPKTKVTIWHTFTEGQEAYLKEAVEGFNAQSDTVEVVLLQQPYADFLKAVYSGVVEGIGPDIVFNYASEAAQYVPAGLVADLSQYVYDEEIGIPGFEEALSKGVLEGEVLGFEDGLIHYVPAYTTGPILFYNKTLFEELELAVPTTWEEMEAAARKIKEVKGVAGLGTDGLTDILQMLIMETPGAGYIDVEKKEVLFDTPEVRAKVNWLVDLAKEGVFAVKSTGDYFSVDFNSGIVGSYIGSSAGFPYINADGFEFAMAAMPAETWYPSWNRGPIVFYYKDDARAEGAYEFVKYFISPEVNAGWAKAVIALAPYAWTRDSDAYKAYIAEDSLSNQALAGVQAHLDKAGSLPAVTGANVVRNAIRDAVIKAAGGEMTADEAWTEAVTKSNAALKGE
ncbi:MAG: extracellular solute-binding protein [Clostridiales bacterium]|nr:extracellular solute-binding protein [Clostridiales bacterium]